jgi:hypothetical protein
MEYTFQKLLEKKDGKVSGPMSPVLFMKEMRKQIGDPYNRLVRVHLNDSHIHNWNEGKRTEPEWTGCDTLLLAIETTKGVEMIAMWVDEGTGGCPVAMYLTKEDDLTITPIYDKNTKYAVKLTFTEIKEIMKAAFEQKEFEIPEV